MTRTFLLTVWMCRGVGGDSAAPLWEVHSVPRTEPLGGDSSLTTSRLWALVPVWRREDLVLRLAGLQLGDHHAWVTVAGDERGGALAAAIAQGNFAEWLRAIRK